jgi:hypothetical protein
MLDVLEYALFLVLVIAYLRYAMRGVSIEQSPPKAAPTNRAGNGS